MSQTVIMDSDLRFFNSSANMIQSTRLFIFCLIFIVISGCERQTPQDYHSLSLQSFEQGKFEEASIQIKNAIRLAPTTPEYRILLAKIHIENSDWYGAEKELNKANELGSWDPNIVIMQSLVYDELAQYEDLLSLNVNEGETTDELLLYLKLKALYMLEDQNAFGETFTLYETTFKQGSYRQLVESLHLMIDNKWSAAKKILITKRHFNSETEDESLELLAIVARQLDDADLLVSTLETQLLSNASDYNLRIELVSLHVFLKEFEKAAAVLKPIEDKWTGSKEISRWRAVTSFYNQQYSTAYESAKNSITAGLNTLEQNAIAGISAFKLEKFEDAQRYLEFVTSELPLDNNFRLVLAQTYLLKGNVVGSYQLLQQGSVESEAYELLKIQTLQKALFSGFTGLVHSLTTEEESNKGDSIIPKALMEYTESASQENVWDVSQWLYWGVLQISTNKSNVLEKTCVNMMAEKSSKFVGLLLCAQFELSKRNSENAINYLNEASKIDSNVPEIHFLKAQVLVSDENINEARIMLEESLHRHPINISTLTMFADLSESTEQQAEAMNFIRKANSLSPKNQQIQTLVVATLFRYGKYDEVLEFVDENGYNEDWENGLISSIYGRSLANVGSYQKSKAFFLQWLNNYPRNTAALYGVINTLDSTNEFLEALGHIDKYLMSVDDDNVKAYKAYFLTLLSRNHEAARVLKPLPEEAENLPVAQYALASNALFEGKVKRAAILISRAYASAPNLRNLFLYGQTLESLGRASEINSLLARHLSQFENDLPAILMLATRIEKDEPSQAVDLYERALVLDENNKIALNNLSYLFLQRSDLESASPLIERLETKHASFPEGLDTVAHYYWKNHEFEKSIATLEKAMRLQPENALIIKTYIERLIDIGDVEKAKRIMKRNEGYLESDDLRLLKSKLDTSVMVSENYTLEMLSSSKLMI